MNHPPVYITDPTRAGLEILADGEPGKAPTEVEAIETIKEGLRAMRRVRPSEACRKNSAGGTPLRGSIAHCWAPNSSLALADCGTRRPDPMCPIASDRLPEVAAWQAPTNQYVSF